MNLSLQHYFGVTPHLEELFAEIRARRGHRHALRVLVVEDDPMTRRMMTRCVGNAHATLTACDAHEAVEDYLLHAPDLVLLDIGLPGGVDGFSVLHQIMMLDEDAFVVMVSGHDDVNTVLRALDDGARYFISKPVVKETLNDMVVAAAAHHGKQARC
jgi:two-component system chemotaxis response regulator CheY